MGDFITFLTYIESEKLTMAEFIILMITLVVLMLIYKAPDIYRIYKEFERKKTMKTFNWKMNMGASASVHHAVSKTQFGDGYAQRVSVGINNQRMDWSGAKTGDWQTVILPIKTFLDEHKGVIPFLWTNPHGDTLKYVCENYEISQKKGNFWEIGLKFEQVF